jgi:hypothetical protein
MQAALRVSLVSPLANKSPAPNRRPRSPVGALGKFSFFVCAPPAFPAVAGEAQRSILT